MKMSERAIAGADINQDLPSDSGLLVWVPAQQLAASMGGFVRAELRFFLELPRALLNFVKRALP
jgi:hypothetical protein